MKAKILFIKTGKTQVLEIVEIYYSAEKIVLIQENGGFTSFFHGDEVQIEIVLDDPKKPNWENSVEAELAKKSQSEKCHICGEPNH